MKCRHSFPLVRLALVALAAVLAACSDDRIVDPPVVPPAPEVPGLLPPNPLTVSPTLDAARADSAVVTPEEGGTVAVTAADGSRFTLELPPNSVLSQTTITLTPLSALGEAPLSGGLIAAVKVEPADIALWEPATLTIVPVRAVALAEQVGFVARGSGAEFSLAPLVPDAQVVKVYVTRLGIVGLGQGTDADRERMRTRHPPTSGIAQYEQHLEQLISGLRRRSAFPRGAIGPAGHIALQQQQPTVPSNTGVRAARGDLRGDVPERGSTGAGRGHH